MSPKTAATGNTEPHRDARYTKLPHIGGFTKLARVKVTKLLTKFCKKIINIKLVFNTPKVKDYFTSKDKMPQCVKSYVVYKFVCTRCNSCYVGRTQGS